jgi:hypothetical protein
MRRSGCGGRFKAEKRINDAVVGVRKMKAIVEAWWVMAFALFWVVVLPVAGLVEIGILVSDRIDRVTGVSSPA